MTKTKSILFGFCILYFVGCKAQNKTKELEFPEVGWKLVVPENSGFISASQFDSLKAETERKANIKIELSQPNVLFVIRKDLYNLFGSTITTLDTTKFKNWQNSYDDQKQLLIAAVKSKEPSIALRDTISSTENIDGLTFQKFYLETYYPDLHLTLENYLYYRLQNGIELSISITFSNKEVGNGYLSLLRASKFE